MQQTFVFLVVLVAATSAKTLHFEQRLDPEQNLDREWDQFKATFNKDYKTREQETLRRIVWEENLRMIQKHNYEADLGKHTYRLGVNEHADLSKAEIRKLLLGFRYNATRKSTGATFLAPSNTDLPASVDWRTKGYVTPIKDQGQCGSCWAFSSTGSLEGQHFKKTGKLVSLSEQQLVDCSGKFGNDGCDGGWMDQAFDYIKANKGLDTERSYPYTAADGRCRFNPAFVGATDNGHVDIKHGDEQALKVAVATVGPISVGIDAAQNSFQLYKSGVYDEPLCNPNDIDHGVLAVGYGTHDGKDYWLVKNSWGTSWGMHGYIMMSRNKDNQCGIATVASYPLV